jgi:AraC family L-rhamnose operon transcriptional activator RhaR
MHIQVFRSEDYFRNRRTRIAIGRQHRQTALNAHRHEFLEIVVVLSGFGIHQTGSYRHRVEVGDVLVIGESRAHGYRETCNLNLVNIFVRADLMRRIGRGLGELPGYSRLFAPRARRFRSHLRLNPAELGQVENWIDGLDRESSSPGKAGVLLQEAYLTLIIGLLARQTPGAETGRERAPERSLGQLLTWVEKNLGRPLRIADLAREAGMSERSFHRKFVETFGIPPGRHVLESRIRRASALLRHYGTARQVGEVARECGFEDVNYFTRCFRRETGATPGAVREKHK